MAATLWRVHRRRSTCGSNPQNSSTSSPVHMTGSMSDGFPQSFVPSNISSHSSCCPGSNCSYLSAESDCQINGCELILCGVFTYNRPPVQILIKDILIIQEPLTYDPGTAVGLKQQKICRGRAEGRLYLLPTQLEDKREWTLDLSIKLSKIFLFTQILILNEMTKCKACSLTCLLNSPSLIKPLTLCSRPQHALSSHQHT